MNVTRYSNPCSTSAALELLASNPVPLGYFIQTLSRYLFMGPQMLRYTYSPPPIEYQYPLQMLTDLNERFVLAHEYGHVLFNFLDIADPNFFGKKEEFAADMFAFNVLIDSGLILEEVPASTSLQSAFLVLTALQILREALDLIRHGEICEDRGFLGHPPIAQRMETLQRLIQNEIDDGREINSLALLLRPAQTLSLLWRDAQDYFRPMTRSQEPHAIWTSV